jgi:hypothetical protein
LSVAACSAVIGWPAVIASNSSTDQGGGKRWGSADLNKKLTSYATETITVPFTLMQKLSRARNLEDAVKVQTDFVKAQTESFNEHAKEIGEHTRAATTATKTPSGMFVHFRGLETSIDGAANHKHKRGV